MNQTLISLINNPWVTGIGGGIISGFLVYFVTSKLLSRKQDKEYSQKVTTANNELLYSVRPLIVKKQIPSAVILESVIESTARKYKVGKNDLLDIPLLADDLIREVLGNSFLDSKQKMDFCYKINELKIEKKISSVSVFEKTTYQKDYISSRYVSTLLAVTASTMVLFISFYTNLRGNFYFNGLDNLLEISTLTSVVVLAPIITMITMIFLRRIKYYEKEIIKKKKKKKLN